MGTIQQVGDTHVAEITRRITRARTIVVKVGSNVLVGGSESVINRRVFSGLVESLATLADVPERQIILVTSGAVAVGRRRLGVTTPRSRTSLAARQALAAVGQPLLMHLYNEEFEFYGKRVAQLLLTRDDLSDRSRFLNARNTLRELADVGDVIPIVNENDTVSHDEIRFGDNDRLAALMTTVAAADLLIILSDVAGLCDANPTEHPDARLLGHVWSDDPALQELCGDTTGQGVGTGGMLSKVRAAAIASSFGVPTVIAPGREHDVLGRILAGELIGTRFVPREEPISSRKAWIRFSSRVDGRLVVDDGAETALRTLGRSLLPRGVREVHGDFRVSATVEIANARGFVFARGLTGYSASDLRKIAGHRSEEIDGILGYHNGDAVLHRDDLVVWGEAGFEHGADGDLARSVPGDRGTESGANGAVAADGEADGFDDAASNGESPAPVSTND